ncbi:MAG: ABC transporter ATP-binding protein [Candidatus Kerfeldbacteria bacterium]
MKTIISCKNITKTFVTGDVSTTVLKGLTFGIQEGEFVAIIGPSGSGKSTLMHILGALDSPSTGTYFLDGHDVSKLTDNELADVRGRKIGFVFQSFNLLPRMTVERNVQLPLIYTKTLLKERLKRTKQVLRNTGMEASHDHHRSNQLSGGQMQRVAIARALVNDPKILLADEPTGNLDQKTGQIVLETFQKLNDGGRTVVLITHDQYVAAHANRVIQILDGTIVEDRPNHEHRPVKEGIPV